MKHNIPYKDFKSKGFSLVEIVVIIAIMIVLLAVLAPSLLRYVENSRVQEDESAMDEVCNSILLALSDSEIFDEAVSYAIPNNYVTYTDSSGVYAAKYVDEEFWAPDGSGNAVTITFNPDENGTYYLANGLVNNMTEGNGSVADSRVSEGVKQCVFSEMGQGKLYHQVSKTIGSTFSEKSSTYQNSSYTIFISFDIVHGIKRVDVYGEWNGTNLSPGCPASVGSGTSEYTPEGDAVQTKPNGGTQAPNFDNSDLQGSGGVGGGGNYTPPPVEEEPEIPSEPEPAPEPPTEPPHEHSYTTTTTAATCTNNGVMTYTCSCGDSYTETIPATGHSETIIPGTEPTCTEAGKSESKQCSICNTVIQAGTPIAALGHQSVTEPTVAATCTEPGLRFKKTCSRCQAVLSEGTVIEPHGHAWQKVRKPASCEYDGMISGTCAYDSSHTMYEVLPALGHIIVTTPGYAPTCTESGLTDGEKCTRTNECSRRNMGYIVKEQTVIPALGHSPTTMTAKAPTCTEEGKTAGTYCSVCDEILQAPNTIPALGHAIIKQPGTPATCTTPGLTEGEYCTRCSYKVIQQEISANGHIDVNGDYICDNCGINVAPACPIVFNAVYFVKITDTMYMGMIFYEDGSSRTDIYDATGNFLMAAASDPANTHTYVGLDIFSAGTDIADIAPDGYTITTDSYVLELKMFGDIVYGEKLETHIYGDYEYCYNHIYVLGAWQPVENMNGWGVRVLDKTKALYGNMLTTIDDKPITSVAYTFQDCINMTVSPRLPDTVIDMEYTFAGCTSLTTVTNFPTDVTRLVSTFRKCSQLTTVPTIPNSVTNMSGTFAHCTSMSTAPVIPNSVTNMNNTFTGCTSLVNAPIIPTLLQKMDECFYGCTNLVVAPDLSKLTNLVSMEHGFRECTSLTTVSVLPDSLQDISFAFYDCHNLETPPLINKTSNIVNMTYAFGNCYKLKTAPIIPNKVKDMDLAFEYCSALTIAPEIPLGVESMESTFRNCTALKTAPTIPNSVISMYETFRGCSALTGTIVINANPTSHMRCFCLAATNPDAQLWLTGSSTMLNVFYNEKSENSNIQIAP